MLLRVFQVVGGLGLLYSSIGLLWFYQERLLANADDEQKVKKEKGNDDHVASVGIGHDDRSSARNR